MSTKLLLIYAARWSTSRVELCSKRATGVCAESADPRARKVPKDIVGITRALVKAHVHSQGQHQRYHEIDEQHHILLQKVAVLEAELEECKRKLERNQSDSVTGAMTELRTRVCEHAASLSVKIKFDRSKRSWRRVRASLSSKEVSRRLFPKGTNK